MKEPDWEWVEVTTSSVVNLGHSWQGPFFQKKHVPFAKRPLLGALGLIMGPTRGLRSVLQQLIMQARRAPRVSGGRSHSSYITRKEASLL